MSPNLVLEAIAWSVLVTLIAQLVSVLFVWALGLHPTNLIREIEVTQNTAIGVVFFIVSLITALFAGILSADFSAEAIIDSSTAVWIVFGVILATVYTVVAWAAAHRIMGRENNESVWGYMRRELIAEQNAALAFFFGGLAVAPFIAVLFQII